MSAGSTPALRRFAEQMLARRRGARIGPLLAQALGDAYGAGFEFAPENRHLNDLTCYRRHPRLPLGGGRYTDDTQMSIAIAEAILAWSTFARDDLARYFFVAFKRDPRRDRARSRTTYPTRSSSSSKTAGGAGAICARSTSSCSRGGRARVAPVARSGLPRDIECFLRWLEIREREQGSGRGSTRSLRADALHSALLQRLLDGDEPLPKPPPRAFSYPWYELLENGCADVLEAWARPGAAEIVINQYSWKLVRERAPNDWEVTYGDGSTLWRCHCAGDDAFGKKWRLERIDSPPEADAG